MPLGEGNRDGCEDGVVSVGVSGPGPGRGFSLATWLRARVMTTGHGPKINPGLIFALLCGGLDHFPGPRQVVCNPGKTSPPAGFSGE